MATTTTPNLSLTLAVPGTNEPFDVPDVNANFTAIDTEVGSLRATNTTQNNRLTNIEDLTLPTATTPNVGVIPVGTAAERDGFWGAAPGTLAGRVALQNKAPRWVLQEANVLAEQIYLAEYDAATNPRGAVSGAGWYVTTEYLTPTANRRTLLINDGTGATMPSSSSASAPGNTTYSLTFTLARAQKVRIIAHLDWFSGGNAAGADTIRVTNASGEDLGNQRTSNQGTTSLVVPAVIITEAFLPAGSNTLIIQSTHEAASAVRTLNNRRIQIWGV